MRLPALALAVLFAACARPPKAAPPPLPSYSFAVTPPAAGSWTLQVQATFDHAPSASLVTPVAEDALSNVAMIDSRGVAHGLPRVGEAWIASSCDASCTIRYEIDLEALASSCRRIDCAKRVGGAIIGAASSWMLVPEGSADAAIRVTLGGGDPARFATGLRRDGANGYLFRSHELGEASYTAFGDLRRVRVPVPGGAIEVVLLGDPLAMGDDAAVSWISDAAHCVASLYGRFPAETTLFVIPVKGADEVVFGRVLSLAGASVALLVGSDTRASSEHSDWVVVHELSHLGTASLMGEGRWLEEGLATYYEPILRERAGWIREEELWEHFVAEMPRGLPKPGEPASLEDRDDIDSTYWGGALFAMMADLRIRAMSRGTRSLDDVVRAVHDRLGDATHSTRLVDFLRVGDQATGTRAPTEVYSGFAVAGQTVDLAATWQALGVVPGPNGSVTLRDDAPLAAVRRAIAGSGAH